MQMDNIYQHDNIYLYIMESKARGDCSRNGTPHDQENNQVEKVEKHESNDDIENCDGAEELEDCVKKKVYEVEKSVGVGPWELSDWEARRYRSMAARLL
ncbi:hypothetical protein IFM89_029528 [Coptis chinensis]|uniref:Uncharacterized protein n=1 Tax=Coptis chinensis TaxID=261450 RepID=A0A835LEX1_9MAGN|nr:hypothetical protein IFM89_029528 [Coptis chinensis]